MVIKVGINGFGRVGRVVFRNCLESSEVEVCAINDPAVDVDYICYLMKFDSTHGTLKRNIVHKENEIIIDDDLHIQVFQKKYPKSIPWHTAGTEYVVEASGMFTNKESASDHLVCEGVKRVIVTAPCLDVPTLIFGVNETTIKPESRVVSCGSSTLYCLAVIIKLLEDHYGLEEGFCTSIHAMTPSLKPLDGLCIRGHHWRDHRSITQNVIPAATGACKALGRLIPSVRDRVCGLAFRVPVANVSVLDLTVRLKTATTLENITRNIEKFNETTKNIIRTNNEEAVSSDFSGDPCSCILDLKSSFQSNSNSFKLICWYENEYSYACRVLDLIVYSEKQFKDIGPFGDNVLTVKQIAVSQEIDHTNIQNTSKIKTELNRISIIKKGKGSSIISDRLSTDCRAGMKTSVNSVSDKTRERPVCKIWKEEISIARHRPSGGFPPRAAPCSQPECRLRQIASARTKVHQKLEKVKLEFSKMVNITENLLGKSISNKLNTEPLEKTTIESNKEKSFDTSETTGSFIHNNTNSSSNSIPDNKTVGDYEEKIDNENDNILQDENKPELPTTASDFNKETKCIMKTPIILSINNKHIVAQTFSGLYNGLQLQFPPRTYNVVEEEKEQPISRCESLDDDRKNENTEPKLANEIKPLTNSETLILPEDMNEKKLNVDSIENFFELKAKSQENITEAELTESNTDMEDIKHEPRIENKQNHKMNDQLNIIDECEYDLNSTLGGSIKPDVRIEGSVCADETNPDFLDDSACISTKHYGKKQDIFDKLDSNSGSENSFDIEKKTSEVINITDLTSSLEDLDRLDKICRIMEISDELSDKLFATLKGSDGSIVAKGWSFKDLCEKVNLDEFCGKVFGK